MPGHRRTGEESLRRGAAARLGSLCDPRAVPGQPSRNASRAPSRANRCRRTAVCAASSAMDAARMILRTRFGSVISPHRTASTCASNSSSIVEPPISKDPTTQDGSSVGGGQPCPPGQLVLGPNMAFDVPDTPPLAIVQVPESLIVVFWTFLQNSMNSSSFGVSLSENIHGIAKDHKPALIVSGGTGVFVQNSSGVDARHRTARRQFAICDWRGRLPDGVPLGPAHPKALGIRRAPALLEPKILERHVFGREKELGLERNGVEGRAVPSIGGVQGVGSL